MSEVSGHSNAQLQLEDDFGSSAPLSAEEVRQYLVKNPDFFTHHPDLVEKLSIPHKPKGSVSLVELQSEQLRKKVRQLNYKLNQLISIAKQNEKIYRVYADLNLRLLSCKSLADVQHTVAESLQGQLGLATVEFKWFSGANALPEIQKRLFLEKRFKTVEFFFGRLSQHERQLMFGSEPAESAALILLGNKGQIGILAVGSHQAGHFTPDMDTLLLSQLRQLLNILLPPLLSCP
jgi:uncharacterized protein YigA (DUF484 family)